MELINKIVKELNAPYEINVGLHRIGEDVIFDLVIPSSRKPLVVVKVITEEKIDSAPAIFYGISSASALAITVDDVFEKMKERDMDVVCICITEPKLIGELSDKMIFFDEVLHDDPDEVARFLNEVIHNPYYPIFSIVRYRSSTILALRPLGRYLSNKRIIQEPKARGFIGIDPLSDKVYVRNIDSILMMIAKGVYLTHNKVKLSELRELLSSETPVERPSWITSLKEDKVSLKLLIEHIMSMETIIPKEYEGIRDALIRIFNIKK
ncbi:MAG TPA: hypothetical protein ENK81_00895 [Euryarchaeota archaeon]|nr:hypothetical protein [Euryarchaeota archaeon]